MESQRVFFVADFASQTLKVPQQKMVETSYVITSLKKDSCLWRVHCVCVCASLQSVKGLGILNEDLNIAHRSVIHQMDIYYVVGYQPESYTPQQT